LATAIQKRFWGPLAWKKSPKVLFLKPNPLINTMLAQIYLEKYSQTYNFIISSGYVVCRRSKITFCGSLFLTQIQDCKAPVLANVLRLDPAGVALLEVIISYIILIILYIMISF
jgi:hypothetical protein